MAYQLAAKVRDLVPYDPIEGQYRIRLDANESFLLGNRRGSDLLFPPRPLRLSLCRLRYPSPSRFHSQSSYKSACCLVRP